MGSSICRHPAASAVVALLAATVAAQAAAAPRGGAGDWLPFVSVTPLYQGNAGLDRGGDFSVGGVVMRGGVSYDFGGGSRAGVTLNYDHFDYAFSTPESLGIRPPWGIVERYGVTIPLAVDLGDGWSLGAAPSVDWFKEQGADANDALSWGATVSSTKRFKDGNRLGLGVGAFDGIEKTTVFPFLIVDWRLSERWRILNPLPSGPTGPAGLELDYRFDGGWTAGVGAAWRVLRFRLSDTGPTPGGIGQERGVPVFLRVSRRFTDQLALHLYGGVVVAGQLRLERASGGRLRAEDFDPAPLFGATFVARF
jgi:hypothetical protein